MEWQDQVFAVGIRCESNDQTSDSSINKLTLKKS